MRPEPTLRKPVFELWWALFLFQDFNEILDVTEKWGCRLRAESQIGAFRSCLADCELEDLGLSGPPFIWCNNRERDQRILERINQALANSLWYTQFLNVSVVHDLSAHSDHCPLWIEEKWSSVVGGH